MVRDILTLSLYGSMLVLIVSNADKVGTLITSFGGEWRGMMTILSGK